MARPNAKTPTPLQLDSKEYFADKVEPPMLNIKAKTETVCHTKPNKQEKILYQYYQAISFTFSTKVK